MKPMSLLLLISTLPLACGTGSPSPDAVGTLSDKLLLKVGLARSFLSSEKRLVSYGRTSGRLSIVAPEGAREVWGQNLPGYQDFFTLPQVAGAALWNDQSLYITEQNAAQNFDIDGFNRYAQASSTSLAFTFVSSAGDSFKIIKLLADQGWQDETLRPDWAAVDTSDAHELVASFSPSGRRLLAMDLQGSAFDIYKDETAGRMKPDLEGCTTFATLAPDENFRALRWSLDESRIYLGNQQGRIHEVLPENGCAGQNPGARITLPRSQAILDIHEESNQQLLVSQPGMITRIDGKTWTVLESLPTSCQLPMGALTLDATHLLIVCLVPAQALDPDQVPLALPLQDQIQYIVRQLPEGDERAFKFQDSAIGGLAIDFDAKRLYMMSSSRLGRLETHDLLTGNLEVANGLLIDGILNP